MPHTPLSDPISVTEAAVILGLSVRSVQRKVQLGQLPAHKMTGRTGAYVLDRADVEVLLAGDAAEATA